MSKDIQRYRTTTGYFKDIPGTARVPFVQAVPNTKINVKIIVFFYCVRLESRYFFETRTHCSTLGMSLLVL